MTNFRNFCLIWNLGEEETAWPKERKSNLELCDVLESNLQFAAL